MKIGIDAKWYFTGPVSGRVFIQNVLKELIDSHPQIEWHIFLKKADKKFTFPVAKKNVTIHYVWAGLNMLSNIFVLPKQAAQLELDAVLFQTFSPKRNSFKSIVFIHDILFHDYPQYFSAIEKLYFWPLRWTIQKANRIITTTGYVKDALIRSGWTKKNQRIDLAPLGIAGHFRPLQFHNDKFLKTVRQKHKLPGRYLLFVGRLNTRKNVENLVRSLAFINDKEISLVIAGEKDWKVPRLKSLLRDKKIASRIIFTGAVNNEELAALYAMAKIFCFPSWAEGFGLPPLEAMASGVPVVVSKTTSMPEVCGEAVLYIDPNDPEDMAKKIQNLIDDEALCRQKVREGLLWSKNYSWRNTAEQIMKTIFAAMKKDDK